MSRLNPVKGVPMRLPSKGSGAIRKPGQSSRLGAPAKGGGDDKYLYLAGIRDPSNKVTEYNTDQDVCPVCHTDRQFNKNLRLLVSPCYHKMCESCIDRLFTLGPEPCPQCGKVLRKVNFAHQTFEDLKVEKEVAVRKRMAKLYNKTREDFTSNREYDDYLEESEDITFNLLNDIDVDKTEKRIADFQRKNAELIIANEKRRALQQLDENEREEILKREREERRKMVEEADRKEELEAERIQQEISEAVSRGDLDAAAAIEVRGERETAVRAEALASAIPPSIANLLTNTRINLPLQTINAGDTDHPPSSPSYSGPFVAYPYSDPDDAVWRKWYTLKDDYIDKRPGVLDVKKDKDRRFGAGGYDFALYWETEIRSAVESLGIIPLK